MGAKKKSDKTVYQQQVKGEKQKVIHTIIKRVDSIWNLFLENDILQIETSSKRDNLRK